MAVMSDIALENMDNSAKRLDGKEVRRLFACGFDRKTIAEKMGCSVVAVQNHTIGMDRMDKTRASIQNEIILKLLKSGVSQRQISQTLDVSRYVVQIISKAFCAQIACEKSCTNRGDVYSEALKMAKDPVRKEELARKDELQEFDGIVVKKALELQNITETARAIGIDASTVRAILRKHGVTVKTQIENDGGGHYVPGELVHIPSKNPNYPGFELEKDVAERYIKLRDELMKSGVLHTRIVELGGMKNA